MREGGEGTFVYAHQSDEIDLIERETPVKKHSGETLYIRVLSNSSKPGTFIDRNAVLKAPGHLLCHCFGVFMGLHIIH